MVTELKSLKKMQSYQKTMIHVVEMELSEICDTSGGAAAGKQEDKSGAPGTKTAKSSDFEDFTSTTPSASWDDPGETAIPTE